MRIARTSTAVPPPQGPFNDFDSSYHCYKHGSAPRHGVCAGCLRERLLRLCPDCAHVRPCCCSSSSSSSSDLSKSSAADPFCKGIGPVGPVSALIESEPAFRRSRSLAIPIFRRKDGVKTPPMKGWGFWKKGEARMERSRSVAEDGGAKGWRWGFPSPMKAFRRRRAAANDRR